MGSGRSRQQTILSSIVSSDFSDILALKSAPNSNHNFGVRGKDLLNTESDYYQKEEYTALLKESGISTMQDVLSKQGYDGLPKQVTPSEFDAIIANGGTRLSRGVNAQDEEEYDRYVTQFLTGDFYVQGGEAYFGSGMYAFGGENADYNASFYGNVSPMVLSPDAKVYTHELGEHYGFHDKEVLDTFYKLEDRIDLGRLESHYKQPQSIGDSSRLSKYAYIAKGNEREMKAVGLKPIEYEVSDEEMMRDIYAYMAKKDAVTAENMKMAREYFKTQTEISPHDVELIYKHLSDEGYLSNEIAGAKGYDAIKFTKEYVNHTSRNGMAEIWVVLNRTKIAVPTLEETLPASEKTYEKGSTRTIHALINGKNVPVTVKASDVDKGYVRKTFNGITYKIDISTGNILK